MPLITPLRLLMPRYAAFSDAAALDAAITHITIIYCYD